MLNQNGLQAYAQHGSACNAHRHGTKTFPFVIVVTGMYVMGTYAKYPTKSRLTLKARHPFLVSSCQLNIKFKNIALYRKQG